MKKKDPWSRRAGQTISILYLLMFMLSEAYSATATAFERNPRFPGWEHLLGWALFALPVALLASLSYFIGSTRGSGSGSSPEICVYMQALWSSNR